MRNLGFDGWALEFLDGPPEVLSMLCNEINLLRSVSGSISAIVWYRMCYLTTLVVEYASSQAIKLGPLSNQQRAAVQQSRISRWIEDKSLNWVIRRADYGDTAVAVNSRAIKPAQLFKTPQANPQRRQELEALVRTRTTELDREKAEMQDIEKDVNASKKTFNELHSQRVRIIFGAEDLSFT